MKLIFYVIPCIIFFLPTKVRERQQQILEDEMLKRQELEKIKNEQDRILEEERKAREGLEELSKEQQKALDGVGVVYSSLNSKIVEFKNISERSGDVVV